MKTIFEKKTERLGLTAKPKLLSNYFRNPYVMARVKVGSKEGVGFAKCSPKDEFNLAIGFNIAVSRAIDEAYRLGEKNDL